MRPLVSCLLASGLVICGSIALSVNTSNADKPGAPATDPRLAGVWRLQSGMNQSKEIPSEEIKGAQMIVRADKMSGYDKDQEEIYRCTYDFDASATPNTITMTSTMPDLPKSTVKGIYKIEEDRLTLCYALPGADRPTEFKSTKDGRTMLFKFKRDKSADPQSAK